MEEEGCRAQKAKGKEDKAPPPLSPADPREQSTARETSFLLFSPGIEELNSGFAAGSAQPDFAPSCSVYLPAPWEGFGALETFSHVSAQPCCARQEQSVMEIAQ